MNLSASVASFPECPCSVNLSQCMLFHETRNAPYYRYSVVAYCIVSVGVVFNLLTLAIFSTKRQRRQPLNRFLITLAVFDTCFLVLSGCSDVLLAVNFYLHGYVRGGSAVVGRFAYPMACIFRTGCVWVTVGIMMQRYLVVKYPMWACDKAKKVMREKQMIGVIVSFSIIFSFPMFWSMGLTKCRKEIKDADNYIHTSSSSSSSLSSFDIPSSDDSYTSYSLETMLINGYLSNTSIKANRIYVYWLHGLFVVIFPSLILAMLSCGVYGILRRSSVVRKRMTRSLIKNIKTNKMLLSVTFSFLVSNTLTLIFDILDISGIPLKFLSPRLEIYIAHASNSMLLINSSINFFIYYYFSPIFRETFINRARRLVGLQTVRVRNQSLYESYYGRESTFNMHGSVTSKRRGLPSPSPTYLDRQLSRDSIGKISPITESSITTANTAGTRKSYQLITAFNHTVVVAHGV